MGTDNGRLLQIDAACALADLLLGAAYADGSFDGSERQAIEEVLGDRVGLPLPAALAQHIAAFDPATLDLDVAVARLDLRGAADRRGLLALVASVTDADDIHDMAEDAYLNRLADAAGADEDERQGITLDIIWDVSLVPPPMPEH
ncbi:MAG: TerB family tellurite resistance protein [Myxococcota bacterium]